MQRVAAVTPDPLARSPDERRYFMEVFDRSNERHTRPIGRQWDVDQNQCMHFFKLSVSDTLRCDVCVCVGVGMCM